MISLALAVELKEAGLLWRTKNYDFFVIPNHDLDDRVFVLADMVAYTELIQGWPAVGFHGAAEWALDYIFSDEIVWLPTEEQLREEVISQWPERESFSLMLEMAEDRYRCRVMAGGAQFNFDGATASEAYARALLHALRQYQSLNGV